MTRSQNELLWVAHKARFDRLCEEAMRHDLRIADSGIGTLGEKRLHAIIKRYLCENVDFHEVGVAGTRFVSDIRVGNDIYEVQTGSFYPMKKKIAHYLNHTDCTVTVVHPIPAVRWMSWVDPHTMDIAPRKRVSKKGRAIDLLPELYSLLEHLGDARLRFRILMLEVHDFKLLNGYSRDRKKGAERYERIPLSLLEEIDFEAPADFCRFIPEELPVHFTVKEFSALTRLRGRDAYSAVRALVALGLFAPAEPIGRSMGFQNCVKKAKKLHIPLTNA